MPSAEKLKKISYGRLLERVWLTNRETFCFFDFYFIGKKSEEPIVYGGWVFSQSDYRRYVMKIEDLYVLFKEVDYVMSRDDHESELVLPIFESCCLDKIESFDSDIVFKLSKDKNKLQIDVRSHPLVTTSYVVTGRLFRDWLKHVLDKWCFISPALRFSDLWVLPLGGMFVLYNDIAEMYLSDECVYELDDALSLDIDYTLSFGKITYTDESMILKMYGIEFDVDKSTAEVLLYYMKKRMFLSEVGSYVEWLKKRKDRKGVFVKRLDQY